MRFLSFNGRNCARVRAKANEVNADLEEGLQGYNGEKELGDGVQLERAHAQTDAWMTRIGRCWQRGHTRCSSRGGEGGRGSPERSSQLTRECSMVLQLMVVSLLRNNVYTCSGMARRSNQCGWYHHRQQQQHPHCHDIGKLLLHSLTDPQPERKRSYHYVTYTFLPKHWLLYLSAGGASYGPALSSKPPICAHATR